MAPKIPYCVKFVRNTANIIAAFIYFTECGKTLPMVTARTKSDVSATAITHLVFITDKPFFDRNEAIVNKYLADIHAPYSK